MTADDLKKGLINVGIPIEDVYLDPCYAQVQSFVVYQDGKKKVFNIQNVEGKTGVYPIDYDPSYRFVDQHQNISENSHIKPKKTDPCLLCGETMLEAASIQHYIAGTLVESSRREIQCSSGHKYCYTCWSDHIQSLLKHDTLTCLPCPAADCGEILDLQWAPVFLKRPELVNKLLAQRQKHIIDILNLTWCPVPDCGLLVHVNQTFGAGANGSNLKSPSGDDIQSYKGTQFNANAGASVPRMAICGHGHAFCLSCPREAHSPCACHDLSTWQELLRDESQHVDSKDPNSPGYLLLSYPTIKKCGHCDAMMGKSEGCNVITCEHCYAKQCWTCQQDWSTHTASVSTSGAPFYCNRFFAHNGRDNGGEDEEKDDHVSLASASTSSKRNAAPPGMTSHGQKNQKLNKTIHHYSRFMTHFESRNLEFMVKLATIERIYEGLKACQEGNLKWLPGTSSINPLAEHNWEEDSYSALRSLDGKDVVALEDFYEKPEEVLEFLEMAFDELAKCRILLQWTYPFALVELEINQGKAMLASNSAGSQRNKAPIGSILTPELRNEFDGLQSSLEYCTESLSNVVARRRIRGTKQEISVLTTTARVRRLDLEQWIVYYYSLKQTEPVIDYVSSNSSISSASRSQSRDKDNLDDLFAADGLDDQGKYSSSDEDEPKPPKVDPREAARLKHINSIEENDITAPIASKSNIQRKPSALSEIIHNMQFEDDTKKKMRKKIESLYVPKEDEEEEEEEAPPVKEAPRQKVRPVEPPQPPPQPQLTYEQRLIGAKKDPDQEALEHAILISKQEEEFGLNMYDALTPQDEHILHEYMVQGFTREEAILILFEERFGKVSIQSDHITPAMPTLHKVSSQFVTSPHAHLVTEADEPEIEHLMTKGFTREQAIEVMFYNRQRGVSSWDVPTSNRSSARNNNAPPPSMYNNMPPPPPAPVVNERASIELLVSQGYTLEQATSIVRNSSSQSSGLIYQDAPQGNSSMYQQSQQQMMPPVQDNDNDVNRLVSQGFTREQAIQIVETERSRQAPSSSSYYNNNSPSNHTQSYNTQSNNSRNNNAQSNAFNLDHEVNHLMALGYTREQATQVAMASNPGATSSGNTNQSIYRASGMVNNSYDYQDEYYQAPAPATSLYSRSYDTMNTMTNTIANQRQSTNYNNNSNAEFEMERAMIVTQQEREYGTNMYDSKTPADEPEIHSLMGQGYSYDEALLLIFERRYKPQAMNGYPGGSVYSSGYNLPPQGDLSVPSYAGNAIIYGANTGNPVPYDAYNNAAPYGYAGNNQYNSYSQPQGYMDYNNDPNQPSYPPPPGAALTNSKQQERRKTLKSKKSSAAVMSPRSDMVSYLFFLDSRINI